MNAMPTHLCKFIFCLLPGRICPLQTSWAPKRADGFQFSLDILSPPEEILWMISHACTHRLLFCKEILRHVDDEWANLVDKARVQDLNLLTIPGSMVAGLSCEHFFKHCCPPNPLSKPCYTHSRVLKNKIMQLEMLILVVLTRHRWPLEILATYFVRTLHSCHKV
jgi:hypothetical protein